MTLENPFILYGYVKDKTDTAVVGATVHINDTTTTTVTGGYYQIEISGVVDADGDTVTVWCLDSSQYKLVFFTVTASDGSKRQDITLGDFTLTESVTCADTLIQDPRILRLYINTIGFANDELNIRTRTAADAFSVAQNAADNIPYVAQTGQQPTRLNLSLEFIGPDRYTSIVNARDEIQDCKKILVRLRDKYLYGSAKRVWLAQSAFNVDEGPGKSISATLQGQIDPCQIHTCDFITNWNAQGFDTIALDTTSKTGKASIKAHKVSPEASTMYYMVYTPTDAIDMSAYNSLRIRIKISDADFDFSDNAHGLILRTDNDAWSSWNMPAFTAGTWQYMTFDLSAPDYNLNDGANLASIANIFIAGETGNPAPDTISVWIDDVCLL